MLTSVHKEILDDSISGDKLAGGIVDPPFEDMHSDRVVIGKDSASPSLIDNVIIGSRYRGGTMTQPSLGYFQTLEVLNKSLSASLSQASVKSRTSTGIDIIMQAIVGSGGLLQVSTGAGVAKARLSAFSNNFLINKLLLGSSTDLKTTTILDILGNIYVNGSMEMSGALEVFGCTLYSLYADNIMMQSGGDINFWATGGPYISRTLSSFYEEYYNGARAIGLALPSSLYDGSLTDPNAILLASITGSQWAWLAALDQSVSTLASVIFDSVSIGTGSEKIISRFVNIDAPFATIRFATSTPVTYHVKYEIINNLITIQIPSYEFTSDNSYSGAISIDLSHSDFDSLWDAIAIDHLMTGPKMMVSIAADPSTTSYTTTALLYKSTKKLAIFADADSYSSPYDSIVMQLGDKCKFNNFSFTLMQ